jgi:hypothetical protein
MPARELFPPGRALAQRSAGKAQGVVAGADRRGVGRAHERLAAPRAADPHEPAVEGRLDGGGLGRHPFDGEAERRSRIACAAAGGITRGCS